MHEPSAAGVLVAAGWSDRVAAWFHPHRDIHRPGRVTRVERGAIEILLPDGERAVPPAHVAVGDWVALAAAGNDLRIADVLPRWSELGRRGPDGHHQVLAANVDIVFVVAPADRLSAARVERELVLAWESGARPVVLLTKADLAPSRAADSLAERLIGTDVVTTSAVTGAGLDTVRTLLGDGLTAAMLGPSGAGKSTLINALIPDARLAVGDVRSADARGRHTTTSRQLLVVPTGGVVVDMPGLRSLGLDADGDAVAAAFAEIDALARQCRFNDCAHGSEPGCAVNAGVSDGVVSAERFESYRKLQREIAFEERKHDRMARQAEARKWKSVSKAMRHHPKYKG